MEKSYYERLSAQDSSFVRFDAGRGLLTIGAVAIFTPERESPNPIDIALLREHVESRLHRLPRYRQRLFETPFQRHPVWVDDERFDLTHHVRSCAVSAPGGDEQLKALAGSIASRPLDLERPLWELWLVEGLKDGRFAVIAKIHHCLMDGVTGVGVLEILLSPSLNPAEPSEEPAHWKPRKRPDLLELMGDGLARAALLSGDAVQYISSVLSSPSKSAEDAMAFARSGLHTLTTGFTPPPDSPLNQPIGGQRRIEWRELDLEAIRKIKRRLEGSVNDVVLSVVAGAARHFFDRRSLEATHLDLRVVVPVDTRSGALEENAGNHVSSWFVDLPVSENCPLERFRKIKTQTAERKSHRAETPIDRFLRFADWSGSSQLPFWGVRLVQALSPYNLIVTNVQGPKVPLYLLGSRLAAIYPTVPLFEEQGLTVAVVSYQERMYYGLQGDWDLVPDLSNFSEGLDTALLELSDAAERGSHLSTAPKSSGSKEASKEGLPNASRRRRPVNPTRWRPVDVQTEQNRREKRRPEQSMVVDLLLGEAFSLEIDAEKDRRKKGDDGQPEGAPRQPTRSD